jgi:hypothetical protein
VISRWISIDPSFYCLYHNLCTHYSHCLFLFFFYFYLTCYNW